MAARKLHQDMERTFKKVAEGIQVFETIFDKIQQCNNASQKEKLEDQLKREIKKLQRHRDQIKTWAAGNEIKDKKPLLEQRKLIENVSDRWVMSSTELWSVRLTYDPPTGNGKVQGGGEGNEDEGVLQGGALRRC